MGIENFQTCQFSSVHFSPSVMSNSLQPHGLQHTRPPCPSPTTGAYSNSCPLSRWCHPTFSPPVVPFSHLQSFPASGSFQMSQFFASGGHKLGWAQGSPLTLLVGMQTSTATMGNSVEILLKTVSRTAIRPRNPTVGRIHWGNQNWNRHVYPNVHRSTVYNSQDMEAT